MFKTTQSIEDRYLTIIDELIKAGYGWKKYAENVKAQGWISNKQKETLILMHQKLTAHNILTKRKGRNAQHGWDRDSDISDYEAYQSGDYF